jgi:hypothetical protein
METERPIAIMAKTCRARRAEPPRFYCARLATISSVSAKSASVQLHGVTEVLAPQWEALTLAFHDC